MSRARAERLGAPLLDIGSFARRGPSDRALLPAQLRQIARTVRRTPEVMIKVLSHGGTDQGAVQRHFDYLSRKGELELEGDDGQRFDGRDAGKALLSDWDLDLEMSRPSTSLTARQGRPPPKLAHKLIFSMPAGTPPDKLHAAVREFCREQFALQHRYAMVLHTDEPHPHVHVVVKAVSEQGVRLNIKKGDLRAWRAGFARELRKQGVAANATDRAARGGTGLRKLDPIYRAMERGASSHLRERLQRLAQPSPADVRQRAEAAVRLSATRAEVDAGWLAVSQELERTGEAALAAEVREFAKRMAAPRTDQDVMASMQEDGMFRNPGPANATRSVKKRGRSRES